MSILKRFLLSFVFLLGASTALVAGPADDHGLLQVKNGKLSAAEAKGGNAVQLRGMSLYWSNWGAAWWNESAVDQAVDYLGCQILRAPMSVGSKDSANNPIDVAGGYLTNPDVNVAWVKTVVDQAIARGIYVIIDWHDHAAQTHQDKAVAFFTEMAQAYGNKPNVLFEIYNEPITTDWDNTIRPYAEAVIGAIRATQGPDGNLTQNVIIVGTPFYSQMGASVVNNPIADQSNIAYSLHFYAASHPLTGTVGQSAKNAVAKGLCVVATEWGTVLADGTGAPVQQPSQDWVTWMYSNGITWLNWSLNDKAEAASMFKTGTTSLGPWKDTDLTASGTMVKSWLPAPTTQFVVSPSLINFLSLGGTKTTTVTKGTPTGATKRDEAFWLDMAVSGQTITVTAQPNDSTTDSRTENITLTDAAGHTANVKVFQQLNDGNLALGKNAVALSTEGSYVATNVTDGDETSTRWGSYFHPAPPATDPHPEYPPNDPQWIYVDLGKNTAFNRVVLVWEAAYSSHFKIQVASDGVLPQYDGNYTTVYDSGTIPAGKTGKDLTMEIPIKPGWTVRYVRMYSLSRILPYGNSLYEFKIYDDPGIAVWGPDYPVYAGGGEQSLEVWSNVAWTAASNADWLTLKQTTGNAGYSTFNIDWAPNYTGAIRTANLMFTAGSATKTVSVTQDAETRLYLTTTTGGQQVLMYLKPSLSGSTVNNDDGSMDVNYGVNANWGWYATVVNGADWLSITPSDPTSLQLHATANLTGAKRTALVVLRTGSFPLLADVWVGQEPYSQKHSLPAGGGGQYLMIIRPGSWTAGSSAPSWLSVNPTSGYGNGSTNMTASANTSGSTRTATVTVTGGGVTTTTQITQAAVSLVPSPTAISVATAGGTKSITITSNTIWWSAYTTDGGGWLSINTGSYSGSGNGTVYFTVSKNATGKARTATITIIGGDVPTRIVTVTQAK